jgi:hypothetical protein
MRMQLSVSLAILAGSVAVAQISSGTLNVVTEDASGGVVPNASVAITNRNTGIARAGRTNERGEYQATFLPAGPYSVTVESQGFKRATLQEFVLQVDQNASVRITLNPGDVVESVDVTETTPLLEADTSSLGQVIDNKKILDLPLNGRNPFALGLLAGNTTQVFGMGTNLPFVGGGGRFSANEVLLDGIDNNTMVTNGAIGRSGVALTPSVDAVQEFKVKTNAFSAEFGRAAGSLITATMRSGTNQFHGSAFEFLRNDKLDANNFFSNASGLPKAKFRQNQFGGVLGGRIIRDKTFFFVNYQGTRQSTAATSNILAVPPVAIRNGDLSLLRTPIYDPATRRIGPNGTVVATAFPNGLIPPSRISPAAAAILSLIPEPNFGAPDAISRNFIRQVPRGYRTDQYDVRIDHQLTSTNNLFGRWSWSNQTTPQPGVFDGFIGGSNTQYRNIRQFVLTDIHLFSPTVVNELRSGVTRHNGSRIVDGIDAGAAFAAQNGVALFPFPVKGFQGSHSTSQGRLRVRYSSTGGEAARAT